MMWPSKHTAGFTLTEVLVASVLLGSVLTGVYVLFFSVISSWRTIDTPFQHHQSMRRLSSVLERDLNNTIQDTAPYWLGRDDEFRFYTATRPIDRSLFEGNGVLEIRYYLDKGEQALIREEAWIRDPDMHSKLTSSEIVSDTWDRKSGARHVLARQVQDFSLRYGWYEPPDREQASTKPPTPLYINRLEPEWGSPDVIEFIIEQGSPSDTGATETTTLLMPLWGRDAGLRPDASLLEQMRRTAR